jgi:hypothetical protein
MSEVLASRNLGIKKTAALERTAVVVVLNQRGRYFFFLAVFFFATFFTVFLALAMVLIVGLVLVFRLRKLRKD